MNTPAHIVFSLGLLGWRNASVYAVAIAIGALLPDLPMIFFYGYEKIRGVAEQQIWNTDYFLPFWQNIFDVFNSLPLLLGGIVLSVLLGKKTWSMFFSSAAIHCALDFFVHHDDSHRHFYPLSDFRFQSPVSYWDPQHYGHIASIVEMTLFLIGVVALWFLETRTVSDRFVTTRLRWTLLLTTVVYCCYMVFALITWVNL